MGHSNTPTRSFGWRPVLGQWAPETAGGKMALLGSLYLAQGLPYGFFTQALPAVMREQGMSLAAIGLTALLYLPWALKFLWAPLVDRAPASRFGRRRQWILPLQLAAVLCLLALAFHGPSHGIQALVGLVLVVNLVAATQDIATDGLAVSLLSHSERGLGNGVQVAGYRVGMIIGGGALLVVFGAVGWTLTLIACAAVMALVSVPVLLWREPPAPPVASREPAPRASLIGVVRRPGMLPWLGVLLVYKFGDAIGGQMVRPFLIDRGLSLEMLGWVLGGGGFTAGLLGAVVGGWAAGRWGRRPTVVAFGITQALAVAAYALPAGAVGPLLYGVCLLDAFAGGLATVALFTAMMDRCRPASGGTDYTVQASAVVLSTGVAASVSGFVAEAMGYGAMFALSGALSLVGAGLAGWAMTRLAPAAA